MQQSTVLQERIDLWLKVRIDIENIYIYLYIERNIYIVLKRLQYICLPGGVESIGTQSLPRTGLLNGSIAVPSTRAELDAERKSVIMSITTPGDGIQSCNPEFGARSEDDYQPRSEFSAMGNIFNALFAVHRIRPAR